MKLSEAAVGGGQDLKDRERARTAWRWAAAVLFGLAGIGHFVMPEFYLQIVPPSFPAPKLLVIVSESVHDQ